MAIGSLNVVSDLSIFILPMPLIWALNLNAIKRLEVMGLFGIGLLACVASIVRLFYIVQLLHAPEGQIKYLLHVCRIGIWRYAPHLQRNVADCPERKFNQVFSNAEISIGIIVGCLPSLPKFFKHFGNRSRGPAAQVWKTRDLEIGQPITTWRKLLAVLKITNPRSNPETPRRPSCIPSSVKHQISTLKLHGTHTPNFNDDEDMYISFVLPSQGETDTEAFCPCSTQTSLPPRYQNELETIDTVSEVVQMYERAL